MNYQINEIVRGVVAGTFVILGFRTIAGEQGVQVKEVNPADHPQVGRGDFWLPLDAIRPYH